MLRRTIPAPDPEAAARRLRAVLGEPPPNAGRSEAGNVDRPRDDLGTGEAQFGEDAGNVARSGEYLGSADEARSRENVGSRHDRGYPVPGLDAPDADAPGTGGVHRRERDAPVSRLAGWSSDRLSWVSPTITAQHVTVVALIVAAAAIGSAWVLVRAEPDSAKVAPTPTPRLVATPAPPAAAAPAASPAATSPPATVLVHVVGRVRNPGVVELPAGSRVVDAVTAAGGARPRVDLTTVNLARVLVDGEQVLVGAAKSAAAAAPVPPAATPVPSAPIPVLPGAPASPASGPLINLNTATLDQLETLPGIGPVLGQAIIDWRVEHGSFTSVDELLAVSGIGDATLAEVRDLVTV